MRKLNMTPSLTKALGSAPAALVLGAAWLAVEALERLNCYRKARRERAQLLGLGERDLRDIGISRVDAIREAGRSAWSDCRRSAFAGFDLGRPQP
jgi:uncharacterized protein YjiS (DUF1127 family)